MDEIYGAVTVRIMILKEEGRCRYVTVFRYYGTEADCKRAVVDKLFSLNPELVKLKPDVVFQPESKRLIL